MSYNDGIRSFTASGALAQYVRVKATSGSTTTPPEVEVAGLGEQHIGYAWRTAVDGAIVSVKMRNASGTAQAIASEAITEGATIYGAALGYVKDTSSGSAIGVALAAATASGDVIEIVDFTVMSTTAGGVSIADSGNFTTEATAEGAIQEIYQSIVSAQSFIPIPIISLREATTFDVGAISVNGGILASDTTPILEAINGGTDGCQRVSWVASGVDQVIFQTPLPPDINLDKDVVVHFRIASSSTTDAVGFTVESFFNEADSKVSDTSTTNQTATYAEKIATIAAADVPAGAQTLTVGLTPVAHTTDAMYLTACWIEYTSSLRTS